MTTAIRMGLAAALAIVALCLLVYSAFAARQRAVELESQVASLDAQLAVASQPDLSFYRVLLDVEVEQQLTALVASESAERRNQIAEELYFRLDGLPALFPDGFLVHQALFGAAEATDSQDRASYRDGIVDIALRRVGAVGGTDAASVEVDPKLLSSLSGLISALGGFGSALGAVFLFLTGGRRRAVETEMLNLDLEMKRVALAKAQFEAREALRLTA